jgi:hypothetical protein
MPLTAPTFTLTASNTGVIRLVVTNPSTAPDLNQVWRSTASENSGQPIEISSSLKVNGNFTDYNIASGKSYVYFIRAISGSTSLDSVTAQGTITLSRGILHAASKSYGSTNKLPSIPALPVWDIEPHNRPFNRALTEYLTTNQQNKPATGISVIEEAAAVFTARVRLQEQFDTRTLKSLYESGSYLCYRDPLGNKIFGTLANYSGQYAGTYTDVSIVLNRSDYTESVV